MTKGKPMDEISLPDDDYNRDYVFRGVRIASMSSQRPDDERWKECHVYRTEGGSLVLHKVSCEYGKEDRSEVIDVPSVDDDNFKGFFGNVMARRLASAMDLDRRVVRVD